MFALIHDNKIKVGPRDWHPRIFMKFLTDNNLSGEELITFTQPTEPIVSNDWKILPITSIDTPSYDGKFQQLSGPFWTINSDHVTGLYNVVDRDVESIKGVLKEIAGAKRYNYEVGPLSVDLGGDSVDLYTNREDRTTYLDALLLIPDETTEYGFKFKNKFKAVNKAALQLIVYTLTAKIQAAFSWEVTKAAEIDAATTIEQLQAIDLRTPDEIT